MPDALASFWSGLPAWVQDLAVLGAWLAPTPLAVLLVTARYRAWPLVRALLVRHRGVTIASLVLIALSVGLGVAILAEERGLRQASARAAERFDLVVAAPGSEVTAMLAAVYLQSADMPLLAPSVHAALAAHPEVRLLAPLAFGDSVAGRPLIGTTAAFVEHLAGTPADGRAFERADEAVVGAASGFALGETLHPAHGVGPAAVPDAHAGVAFRVTGRLDRTGTPWDRAVIVPLEAVWMAHGLGDGHAAEERARIGPPYDPARMPGVPAIVVGARSLMGNYTLRAAFTTADSMAFFPGEVLARLHGLLGDVRRVLSGMALATEALVALAVGIALVVLLASFARRFAMLRALGAPRGFVFAVAWLHGTVLVAAGAALGVPLGQLAALALARLLSEASAVAVRPALGLADLSLVAAFVLIGSALAALPAWRT